MASFSSVDPYPHPLHSLRTSSPPNNLSLYLGDFPTGPFSLLGTLLRSLFLLLHGTPPPPTTEYIYPEILPDRPTISSLIFLFPISSVYIIYLLSSHKASQVSYLSLFSFSSLYTVQLVIEPLRVLRPYPSLSLLSPSLFLILHYPSSILSQYTSLGRDQT